MSIHDVDKSQDTRNSPMPNMSDSTTTRASDGTTAITNKVDDATGAFVSTKDATVKVNDGDTNRVAVGLLSDGTFGMKVSQDGYDVSTATDDQLVFNSNYNMFKIVASGSVNLGIVYTGTTVAAGTQSYTLTHNLGYAPVVMAYSTQPDANMLVTSLVALPYATFFTSGVLNGEFIATTYYTVTSTTVTFYVTHHTGTDYAPITPTWNVKYYLMRETAN